MKDAYYFPHFCNARHDRKIKRVTKELGVEGYGIYFMVLEVLREQTDFKYPLSEIDLLAYEFGTSEQKVRVVICNYGLFEVDENNNFFSLKLVEFMQPYLKMKAQRVNAGKASAEKRKQLNQQPLNDRSTTVQQSKVKESKVKESKVKESKELDFGDFTEACNRWLKYKSDRKEKYVSDDSIQTFVKKLIKLSDNNPVKANLIIEQSIANNWAGIFELKQQAQPQQTNPTPTIKLGKA
jgi:hypothetical protein